MSKGSKPRPFSVSVDEFSARWEATFGKCSYRCLHCGAVDDDIKKVAYHSRRPELVGKWACDVCGNGEIEELDAKELS